MESMSAESMSTELLRSRGRNKIRQYRAFLWSFAARVSQTISIFFYTKHFSTRKSLFYYLERLCSLFSHSSTRILFLSKSTIILIGTSFNSGLVSIYVPNGTGLPCSTASCNMELYLSARITRFLPASMLIFCNFLASNSPGSS